MENDSKALAEVQGLGQVRLCACGSVNLSLGAVTLHLDPTSFLRAASLLQLAAEEYLKRAKCSSDTRRLPLACTQSQRTN